MNLDPALAWLLRLALAWLLLAAARHKLRDPAGFRNALAGYRLLPERAVSAAARAVPAVEAAAGVGLLVPGSGAGPALLAAGLLTAYGAAIALNLARGRSAIDCGCGGPAGGQRLSWGLVVRNALLVGMALAAALPAGPRALLWVDGLTIGAGLPALASLYAAADLAIAQAQRLQLRRGEA